MWTIHTPSLGSVNGMRSNVTNTTFRTSKSASARIGQALKNAISSISSHSRSPAHPDPTAMYAANAAIRNSPNLTRSSVTVNSQAAARQTRDQAWRMGRRWYDPTAGQVLPTRCDTPHHTPHHTPHPPPKNRPNFALAFP